MSDLFIMRFITKGNIGSIHIFQVFLIMSLIRICLSGRFHLFECPSDYLIIITSPSLIILNGTLLSSKYSMMGFAESVSRGFDG